MKTTITLFAAVLMLCTLSIAANPPLLPIFFDTAGAVGETTGTSLSGTIAVFNSSMIGLCLLGDTISGGHDDISSMKLFSGAHQVGHFTTIKEASTQGANNHYLYLAQLVPDDSTYFPLTGTFTITTTAASSHFLSQVASSYANAGSISGQENIALSGSSPMSESMTMDYGNDWVLQCGGGVTDAAGSSNTILRVQSSINVGYSPTILDSNGPVNPVGTTYSMSTTSGVATWDDQVISAEMIPGITSASSTWEPLSYTEQLAFTNATSWTWAGTSNNVADCNLIAVSAWQNTTSPYTLLTPTSVTCDSSHNVVANFSSAVAGYMVIVFNDMQLF